MSHGDFDTSIQICRNVPREIFFCFTEDLGRLTGFAIPPAAQAAPHGVPSQPASGA